MKKLFSGMILTLLLTSMLTLAFNVQPAKSDYVWTETIYIRADGSIEPLGAPISTVDNVTYTLTDNIVGDVPDYSSAIVIERNNTVLDGAGYTLQGMEASGSVGMELTGRGNVTIKNMKITAFDCGLALWFSSYNNISVNNITNNTYGIWLGSSQNNAISRNNITANNYDGIWLDYSSNNNISRNSITNNYRGIRLYYSSNNNAISGNNITNNNHGVELQSSSNNNGISGNNITENYNGIYLDYSSNNSISRNNITANKFAGIRLSYSSNNSISVNNITNNNYGIKLYRSSNNSISVNNMINNDYGVFLHLSSNNKFYHNNFVDNTNQVGSTAEYANSCDDGYPSGGNYWSDYGGSDLFHGPPQNETGSDGIGDTPYIIDENSQDNYPLMKPYPWDSHDIGITHVEASKTTVGQGYNSNINITITLFNYGNNTESFNVTANANSTIIDTVTNITFNGRNSTTITVQWNTTGIALGIYTISAFAHPILGETDFVDNTLIGSTVTVTIPGDVDGDFDVDLYDAVRLLFRYGLEEGEPNYDPNCDIDGDGQIFLYDAVILLSHYGDTYP